MSIDFTYTGFRKSVMLIAVVSVAATLCYGSYFDAGDFQAKAGKRASAATTLDPAKTSELATAFKERPERLTDDEYVAAALAFEKELHASQAEHWQRTPIANHFAVYDGMVKEIKEGLRRIGPHQPGLSRPLESLLREAKHDLPIH